MIRAILNIVPRIALAAILWSYIDLLYRYVSVPISMFEIQTIIRLALSVLALTSIAIAIITLNGLALSASLPLITLNRGLLPPINIALYLVVIGALLAVDNVRRYYRLGQERYTVVGARDAVVGALLLVLLFGAVVLSPTLLSLHYIDRLLGSVEAIQLEGFARAVMESPLLLLSISISIGLAMYRIISTAFEVVAVYLFPMQSSGLKLLLSREDVDIFFRPPLKMLMSFIVASVIAPLLYTAIADVFLYRLLEGLYMQSHYISIAVRFSIALILLAIISVLVGRFNINIEFSPKPILVVSATLLLLLYTAGVFVSFTESRDILFALTSPNITFIALKAVDIYREYYMLFLLFIDIVPRLFGVAP